MKNLESHYTATGFVLNQAGDRVLFIFHKKLRIWLPPGGHVNEGEMPHLTVVREVLEETGIHAQIIDPLGNLNLPLDCSEIQIPAPFAVFHEKIPAHGDKQAHLHYDFLYKMRALNENLAHDVSEVEAAYWFTLDEILHCKTTAGVKAVCEKLLDSLMR